MNDMNRTAVDAALIAGKVRSEMARVFVERLADSALAAPPGLAIAGWLIYSVAGWPPALGIHRLRAGRGALPGLFRGLH